MRKRILIGNAARTERDPYRSDIQRACTQFSLSMMDIRFRGEDLAAVRPGRTETPSCRVMLCQHFTGSTATSSSLSNMLLNAAFVHTLFGGGLVLLQEERMRG